MMLGKRARPPMKRTTSMTEFTLDFNAGGAEYQQQFVNPFNGGGGGLDQQLLGSTAASSRPHRRNSGDFGETANFLRVCSLCKRRLIPGRDIYMYRILQVAYCTRIPRVSDAYPYPRSTGYCTGPFFGVSVQPRIGDTAFCSLECRQQQMTQDERKEKCSLPSKTKETATTTTAGGAQVSATG
ncbi:hypothetical protein RD792_011172 [Penstemon davidsonii]|uniref:FLZ-type domain-containing protein n=1 Tax=Penstemon davidsonii TaxID=160366 RepID=A0ABR0D3V3_9LAMI|nr:hypothetical protein RD792_011172 [Penstemon davidsonii]